jgi:hypothetical protein
VGALRDELRLLEALLVLPELVVELSLVPPCSWLQPAKTNAAPSIRIAFFIVEPLLRCFQLAYCQK